jgi:hypothetical protein
MSYESREELQLTKLIDARLPEKMRPVIEAELVTSENKKASNLFIKEVRGMLENCGRGN